MNNQDVIFFALCVTVGAGITIQAATNAALGKTTRLPSFSALMSFLLGIVPIFIYYIIESKGFKVGEYANVRWWQFLGGFLGAIYVFVVIIAVPRLGTATVLSATIAGQVLLSIIVDHFGWLGVQQTNATWGRIVGAILIVTGAVMMKVF